MQPNQIPIVKVPEYFPEYREKDDGLAAFLLVAKVHPIIIIAYRSQSEPIPEGDLPRWKKNFISIMDYAERENKSVLEMSVCISFLILTPFWYSLHVTAYVTIIEPVD